MDACHWHHVFDVAGRADYRAGLRQWYFNHYLCGYCGWLAQCNRWTFRAVRTHSMSIISALLIIVLVAAVTYLVVFIERGQRKILVNYAKRQVGNKMYGGQSSHLPLKLNMAGVIPPIFASSI